MNPTWRRNYLRYKSYFLNVIGKYQERSDVKAYLEILLSLLTISIFAIFALKPTLLTIAGLLKEIEGKEKTLIVMDQKIEKLSKARSLFDRERQNVVLLGMAIPQNSNPEGFAQQIEGLINKHQTILNNLTINDAPIVGEGEASGQKAEDQTGNFPQDAKALPISVGTSISYEQYQTILSFLSDFEFLRRPVKIDSLAVSQRQDKDKTDIISLVIEGRLPYLTEPRPISNK